MCLTVWHMGSRLICDLDGWHGEIRCSDESSSRKTMKSELQIIEQHFALGLHIAYGWTYLFFFHSKTKQTNRDTKMFSFTAGLQTQQQQVKHILSFPRYHTADFLKMKTLPSSRRASAFGADVDSPTSRSFNKWWQHLCRELLTVTVFYGCVDSCFPPLWPISTVAAPPHCLHLLCTWFWPQRARPAWEEHPHQRCTPRGAINSSSLSHIWQ